MKSMSMEEFYNDLALYESLNKDSRFEAYRENFEPRLDDKYEENSSFNREYFAQSVWGARKILEANPILHVDVGSDLGGFLAHLLCFRDNILSIDIRPSVRNIRGLMCVVADATEMNGIGDESIESLSAMSSLEHFGLGRYGDKIDPNAWAKALNTFTRVLKPLGRLYISVRVSETNRVIFNKYRLFNPYTIIDAMPKMELIELSASIGRNARKALWLDESSGQYIRDEDVFDDMEPGSVAMYEFRKKEKVWE